jgi:predicted transposase/invertase (TIGR01784 family)
MKHHIDPKIDCVFKAVLGAKENNHLLIHFLNAILQEDLSTPIAGVEILNPYNEKEYLNDKLSIVDVKARDQQGQLYQVEIQLLVYPALPARMLYTWADLYSQQLQSGQPYEALQPTYSIWLVAGNVIADDDRYAREYRFRDDQASSLIDHGGIWLLELNKFRAERIETEQQRWLKFFKEGEQLDDEALPEWMNTDEMRQAMNTVRVFSEKERHYDEYQARMNYQREQISIRLALEQGRQALEQERQALEQERQAREQERQAREQERQAREQERQAREQERRAKEAALQEKDAATQREAAALQEIERLKALLAKSKP